MRTDLYGWNGFGLPGWQAWWQTPPLPVMTGSQQIPAPGRVQPRVFTVATQEGRARTCVGEGEFRYRRGERLEVLVAQQTPRGNFFLVLSPQGCAGWVPARHVSAGRRGRGPGGDEGGPDAYEVALDITDVEDTEIAGAEGAEAE